MNGIVNAQGFSSIVVFEWGETTAYGNTMNAIPGPVTGSTDVIVSANLTNLQSATTYHYRLRATNAVNVSYSDDMSFTTEVYAPQLVTNDVTNILAFSATSGGNITFDGGSPVTARGVVWNTNPSPTLYDYYTVDGAGSGSFTSEMTGLTVDTTYYVRAYATNAVGTSYGNERTFTTYDGIIALTTIPARNITNNAAIAGGDITTDGGVNVTARGVVWSIAENPTLESNDGMTNNGTGAGVFLSSLTGLAPQTIYYLRAYATNSIGTSYGANRVFETFNNIITDYDGNVYGTEIIGTQEWMCENLKTTHYSNGIPILNPTDNSDWENNTTGAYAWYNNDNNWKDRYGALYNWYAVNNTNGLCPVGWHVPSFEDFDVLAAYLGGTMVAGGKMKSTYTSPDPHPRWDTPNTDATNESKWSGLPGGLRYYYGGFGDFGLGGWWWTTTEISSSNAKVRSMGYQHAFLSDSNSDKNYGFYVRCLKND